jgi:hypothetical protein
MKMDRNNGMSSAFACRRKEYCFMQRALGASLGYCWSDGDEFIPQAFAVRCAQDDDPLRGGNGSF